MNVAYHLGELYQSLKIIKILGTTHSQNSIIQGVCSTMDYGSAMWCYSKISSEEGN